MLNSTSNAFDEIIIEGVVFSPQGKLSKRFELMLHRLCWDKIQSLNLDMIEKIQAEEQRRKKDTTKTGESRALQLHSLKTLRKHQHFSLHEFIQLNINLSLDLVCSMCQLSGQALAFK
ncbi:MAG: hypothetical protein R3A13_08325 [Bdellovibrionota bacterium]